MIAIFALSAALSAAPIGRAIDGQVVAADGPVALVFWSQDCRGCGAAMAELEDTGLPIIAINTDAASQRSSLRAFSSRHDISSPIISDADGRLQQQFQLREGVVLLDDSGSTVWHRDDTSAAVTALLDDSTTAWLGEAIAQTR